MTVVRPPWLDRLSAWLCSFIKRAWKALAIVGALAAIAAAYFAYEQWQVGSDALQYQKERDQPSLVILPPSPARNGKKSERYAPLAPGLATVVPVRSVHNPPVAITRVRLHSGRWVRTPQREQKVGALPVEHRIYFHSKHYDESGNFSYCLSPEEQEEIKNLANLYLAIIWPNPNRESMTYIGKVTVHSIDDGEVTAEHEAEVDRLDREPVVEGRQ